MTLLVSLGKSCTLRSVAYSKNSSGPSQHTGVSPFVSLKQFSNSNLLRPKWDLDLKHNIYSFLLEIVCHLNRVMCFTLCLRIGGNCNAELINMYTHLSAEI